MTLAGLVSGFIHSKRPWMKARAQIVFLVYTVHGEYGKKMRKSAKKGRKSTFFCQKIIKFQQNYEMIDFKKAIDIANKLK